MKVAFLYTNTRGAMVERIKRGEDHDNHLFGALRLQEYGIQADVVELESVLPLRLATWFRRHASMHAFHVPLLMRLRGYDAVLTSAALGALLARALTGIGPRKWLMYDYNISGPLTHPHTVKERIFAYLMQRVDGFITLGAGEAEAMRRLFPEKSGAICHIPFGCDTAYFSPQPEREQSNLVLSVGRDPGRDWRTFLAAVRDTDMRVETTARPSALEKAGGVPANVSVCSWSPLELLDGYARASVVALPLGPIYPEDTMGVSTLVEAMAMGKAIVATDTATMRSYLTHGVNAVLVPQGDALALRAAISDLLRDGAKRRSLGRAARETVCRLCDADSITRQLAEYLKQVVQK